jgi:hypothetical protein
MRDWVGIGVVVDGAVHGQMGRKDEFLSALDLREFGGVVGADLELRLSGSLQRLKRHKQQSARALQCGSDGGRVSAPRPTRHLAARPHAGTQTAEQKVHGLGRVLINCDGRIRRHRTIDRS